jgi:hypothetical protein
VSTPVICGTNSGYHLYTDMSDTCNLAIFHLGQGSLLTREWTIRVGTLLYYSYYYNNKSSFVQVK